MATFLFKFLPNAHAQKDSLIPEFPGLTSTYDLSLDLDLGQKEESGVVWLRETRSGVRPDYMSTKTKSRYSLIFRHLDQP